MSSFVSRGSDRLPTLAHATVEDVMHRGVVSCSPETPLANVARVMAMEHIHAVVVSGISDTGHGEHLTWGVVSDLDLVSAALVEPDVATAGDVAATEVLTVESAEALTTAARLMVEHQLTHLLVVEARGGSPVGVVSSLDVAGAMAWGEA